MPKALRLVVVLVGVLAGHVMVFLLLPTWRRPLDQKNEHEAVAPIFLPPLMAEPPRQSANRSAWQAPLLYRGTPARRMPPERKELEPALAGSAAPPAPPSPPAKTASESGPDWRAQGELVAEQSAQRIVAAEDDAARRAQALTSKLEPLAPPRVPRPEFGWDYAATHRFVALPQGGFVYSINDNCQILVLPLPFIGCVIGKRAANGELFMNLHPPVKYGDWDWRAQDP